MALTAQQRAYLKSLNPRVLACKGNRRHPFPIILPGEPIPPGVMVKAVEGGIEVTFFCPNCTRWKRETTGIRGVLGISGHITYGGGGEDYIATGLDLSALDHREFYGNVVAETIRKAARR